MINLDDIINRLKVFYNTENDNDIADKIDMHPSNFSQRKKRGTLFEPLIKLAINEKLNVDWLLTGEGPIRVEEKTGAMAASQEQVQYANGRYDDVYSDVREILASGDDFIIRALRERLKDFRIAVSMNHERRDLKQRLTLLENEMRAMKGGGGSPGERPGGASTDAGTTPEAKEGDADIGKKAM